MATIKKPAKKPKAPPDAAVTAYYEQFRDRLIAARKAAKLSQAALADLLDIPIGSYKQMEGKRLTRFPLHKIEKLCNALRETHEFIITGKRSRIASPETKRAA